MLNNTIFSDIYGNRLAQVTELSHGTHYTNQINGGDYHCVKLIGCVLDIYLVVTCCICFIRHLIIFAISTCYRLINPSFLIYCVDSLASAESELSVSWSAVTLPFSTFNANSRKSSAASFGYVVTIFEIFSYSTSFFLPLSYFAFFY